MKLLNKYMKLENQVVSLELAKKLKSLGFEQKSLFCWVYTDSGYKHLQLRIDKVKTFGRKIKGLKADYKNISAYTLAELGEEISKYGNYITWKTNKDKWAITKMSELEFPELDSKTEANARAKMLIYLKENKLI